MPTTMDGLLLLHLLTYVSLVVHLLTMWYVLSQCWRTQMTAWVWREAWVALALAMSFLLVFRIADLWEPPTFWRPLLAGPMSLAFLLGFARLARLLRLHPLRVPPAAGQGEPHGIGSDGGPHRGRTADDPRGGGPTPDRAQPAGDGGGPA